MESRFPVQVVRVRFGEGCRHPDEGALQAQGGGDLCYGFNPGAKLREDIVEDERVWGCVEWGIGHMRSAPTPSHSDGVCLNASVWLDGKQILDRGRSVNPELAELASKLGQ
ncbi:MAG TPA: hypothetical protein VM050_12760 [Patescibacteria group bacterium]|nr:hypothetical protein [Patescibacteria group bacterium]